MHLQNSFVEKVQIFATRMMVEKLSKKFVYHDARHLKKVIKAIEEIGKAEKINSEDFEKVYLVGYFFFLGFTHDDEMVKAKNQLELYAFCKKCSAGIAQDYLYKNKYPEDKTNEVIELLKKCFPKKDGSEKVKDDLLAQIVVDALKIDWSKPKAKERMQLLHEEILLLDQIDVGKKGFYNRASEFLINVDYHTNYGKTVLQPAKNEFLKKLQKETKDIQKNEDIVLKKELDISDSELKELKKSLKSVRGRDDRGIQTLFRTTIKNHYTINEMVDKKANIMISVNAIILSLILGGVIGESHHDAGAELIPKIILAFTCITSIIFAIIAIRPNNHHGRFTEEEIRSKKGNLLFYGNFHNMNIKDFEWGMYQMLNDSEYMYNTMIRDLYFLGQTLNKKNMLIRWSLMLFLFGLITTMISFFIIEYTAAVPHSH